MMKQILILFLCLALVICAIGCNRSDSNLETPPATSQSTPAPTTTAPTTQPTPPPTTVPTTPAPTIVPTCPPVEGDLYWGEFRGKGFKNPNGLDAPIRSMVLYSDGTCEYKLAITSSSWPGPTVWTFDGEYLYIGRLESGEYSIFRYVGAEDPNESKLIYVKSDHDLYSFSRLPDGQEFNFGGILRWPTE